MYNTGHFNALPNKISFKKLWNLFVLSRTFSIWIACVISCAAMPTNQDIFAWLDGFIELLIMVTILHLYFFFPQCEFEYPMKNLLQRRKRTWNTKRISKRLLSVLWLRNDEKFILTRFTPTHIHTYINLYKNETHVKLQNQFW